MPSGWGNFRKKLIWMKLRIEENAGSSPVLFWSPVILYNNTSDLFINICSAKNNPIYFLVTELRLEIFSKSHFRAQHWFYSRYFFKIAFVNYLSIKEKYKTIDLLLFMDSTDVTLYMDLVQMFLLQQEKVIQTTRYT